MEEIQGSEGMAKSRIDMFTLAFAGRSISSGYNTNNIPALTNGSKCELGHQRPHSHPAPLLRVVQLGSVDTCGKVLSWIIQNVLPKRFKEYISSTPLIHYQKERCGTIYVYVHWF